MAAPEIRLSIGLDLEFFRGQMRKAVNIAQSEFTAQLAVKIDRNKLNTELNNLQKAIKRRSYYIEIKGNLDDAPSKIASLKKALSDLEGTKIDLGIGGITSIGRDEARKIRTALRRSILENGGKILVPTSIVPAITNADVATFKKAVAEKLSGLSVDVKVNAKGSGAGSDLPPDFIKHMQELGLLGKTASGMTMRMQEGGSGIKQQLNEAVKSAEKIKSVFDGVAKNIATTGKSIANIQGKRLGLSNVPLMAGAVEKKVERSAAAIGGTSSSNTLKILYPEISKTITSFAVLRRQIEQNTSKLSNFSLIIGLAAFSGVPLAKSIVKLTGSANDFAVRLDSLVLKLEAAVDKAASNILSASSGKLLSGSRLAGLLPAAYRGINPAAGPAGLLGSGAGPAGLLPPAYRGIAPSPNAGALPPAYRGLPFGFDFKSLPDPHRKEEGGKLVALDSGFTSKMRERYIKHAKNFLFGLEVKVKEILSLPQSMGGLDLLPLATQMMREAENRAEQAKLDRSIDSLLLSIDEAIKTAQVRVRDVGRFLLSGAPQPKRLAAGETQSELFARRTKEAQARSMAQSEVSRGPIVSKVSQVKFAPGLLPGKDFAQESSNIDKAFRVMLSTILRKNAQIEKFFAENFSANSQIPQSTRKLAAAMDSAASSLRQLTGTKSFGALPTRDMVGITRFSQAIKAAIRIDMDNALRQQMEGRLLPEAGNTGRQSYLRKSMEGTGTFSAPTVGFERVKRTPEQLRQDLLVKREARAQERSRLQNQQLRGFAGSGLSQQTEIAGYKSLQLSTQKLLASATAIGGQVGAQETVTKAFYQSMEVARQFFNRNFSANSYLSKATINLAAAMQQAAQGMKLLTGARGPIAALPSREMVGARKFKDAIRMAREIDLKNTLAYYNSKKYLPQAGQTSYRSPEQIAGKTQAVDTERQLAGDGKQQARALITSVRGQMAQLSLPAAGQTSAPVATKGINALNAAIRDLGGKAAVTASKIQGKVKSALREAGDFVAGEGKYYSPSSTGVGKDGSVLRKVSDFISGDSGRRTGTGPVTPPLTSTTPVPPGAPPAPPGGGGAGAGGGGAGARGGGPWAQTPLSLGYYKNAFKYSEALKVADASMRNFSASQIPLIGGIKNLAGEFGQAAKQVLIYGVAYKGLAFLTGLPGRILDAAKKQQQFNNGLKVATQDTGTFGKELLYVDNVQRAFGLNLETTRTGFTRLFASMAPTGFDSGSIEKLFTGISAATASLQLTPDKAERVIYAFGQMASKGQIMSEELKGQLGDVLPGALAIFSKAAGMSVKDFSKAMEDGVFVGGRFREVFAKVSDELMNRFGTGAQAAGRSLQGLINTVGGDFQRTLESFAPLANSAAQAILGPLGGSLKQLALSAQISTGEIERVFTQLKESQQDLKDLRTSAGTDDIITADEAGQIKAAEKNVAALTVKYKSLQQAASDPAIAKQVQDITKFTEELSKAGTFVMNVAKTIGGLLSPAINFLGTNLTTVIGLITSFYIGFQTARLAAMSLMGVLLLYRTLSAILGFGPAALGANALAAAFNGLGIAATGAQVKVIGLRWALGALVASTVIGAVVGGIMLIVSAFASMRDRANEASQASRDAAKSAVDAAQMGGVAQAAMSIQTILGESRKAAAARKALEGIMARSTKAQRAGIEPMSLSVEDSVALKGSPLTKGMVKPALDGNPQMQVPPKLDAAQIFREFGSVAGQQDLNLREAKSALATAIKVAKETGQNIPTPGATPPEDTSAADTKAADKARQEAEKRLQQEQQRAIELSNHGNNLEKIDFDRKIQLSDSAFEHEKSLIDSLNEYRLSGLNDMQARQEKVVQDLKKIQLDAVDTVRKATQKAQEAQLNVVTAQRTAAAAVTGAPLAPALPSPSGAGTRKLPGSNSGRLDASGENGADMPVGRNNTIQSYHNGVVKAIANAGRNGNYIVIDFIDDLGNRLEATYSHIAASVKVGQSVVGGQTIGRFDASGNTRGAHNSVDINSPGNNGDFNRNQETPAARRSADILVTGRVQGSVGSSAAGSSASGASFRMETKQQKENFDLIEEKAKRSAAIERQRIEMQRAVELAYVKTASVIKANIDAIFPVEQQKLDLRLQQMRQSLLMQGMPQEYINYEMNRAAAMEESAMATKNMTTSLTNAKIELAVYNDAGKKGVELTIEQQVRMGLLKKDIEGYEEGLASLTNQQKAYNIAALESAIASIKNADALKAQQDAIQLIEGNVESATGSYKNFAKEVAQGGDPAEALKKFQESIADQVLTVFLDYAFQPVEQFLKDSLKNMFDLPTEEDQRKKAIADAEAQLGHLKTIDANVSTIAGQSPQAGTATPAATTAVPAAGGQAAGGPIPLTVIPFGGAESSAMSSTLEGAQSSISKSMEGITSSVEKSSFKLLEGVPPFEQALTIDLPGQVEKSTEALKAKGSTFNESLGKLTQGVGIAIGSIMGIMAGMSQIKKGGTGNTLMGIGSILASVGGGIGGFMKLKGANGGTAAGGWKPFPARAFANGGMVKGPTLGLVGEGKYNEAIVPLPDGRSIPVQMRGGPGGGSSRDLLASQSQSRSSPSVLSMSFQSTTINGVEYVDRAQLEMAMAETRRVASRDGAARGANLAIDRLANSPSSRRRAGIR